ncbi:MAG: desulfoferrodoxin [Archaeoglobus sp.]|jgi:superoxide reductase|nr:MAG: desulfoferrodoxin [Archaeoglobus sp.]
MMVYTEGDKASNHKPKIECPESVKKGEKFELRVYVEGHPNKVEHSIRWIETYFYEDGRDFNPVMLCKSTFSEFVNPDIKVEAKLENGGKIVALAYCNKHGLWSEEKEIKVE